ncbi:MAG: cupin domain-containing protein, partial [Thermoleophilia bacterium]
LAQGGAGAPASQPVVMPQSDLEWSAGPPALPPGAQMAVLDGDPAQAGPFTVRLKLPANYRIPPHTHPADEHVTIVSGNLKVGMGRTFDASKTTELGEDGYFSMPAGHQHYVLTSGETTVQLHGTGPWGITYVNPADDPRNTPRGRRPTRR